MPDTSLISAKYGDLTSLREAIAAAKSQLAAIGADVMSFTQGAESQAWDDDAFAAKFTRVDQNNSWVDRATTALLQTESAIDSTEQGFRSVVSRNAANIASA